MPSVRIAKNWERAQEQAATPHPRKVALRAAMVMSPDAGGVFDVPLRLVCLGLGGPVAGGAQYFSWTAATIRTSVTTGCWRSCSRGGRCHHRLRSSGVKGESGAKALGGSPDDPGNPVTHDDIVNGNVPSARGGTMPPAQQIR